MASIPGIPFPQLRDVPTDRAGWLHWREGILQWRTLAHEWCNESYEKRRAVLVEAEKDPAFFLVTFASLQEPRTDVDWQYNPDDPENPVAFEKPAGWYPWVPFPFQVDMIRWIEAILGRNRDPSGKMDGVVEKSRDMGATWVFSLYMAHQFLFSDNFAANIVSHTGDVVDKTGDIKSVFYKIESLIGINSRMPHTSYAPDTFWHDLPTGMPSFLRPDGWDPDVHDQKMKLTHPTKNNAIYGETTTTNAATGSRCTMMLIDEAARIKPLEDIWGNIAPVTNHRFAVSSADLRENSFFYDLVQKGKGAQRDASQHGPDVMSLPWFEHPLRDSGWLEMQRARAGDIYQFEREYEMNYHAGYGDWVYPASQSLVPAYAPYDPTLGDVFCSIDPGIRDPSAVLWFQRDPVSQRYRLIEALVLETPTADYLAPILIGSPPDHPVRDEYRGNAAEVMDFTWSLTTRGLPVRYVGDSYGNHRSGANINDETFYMALWRRARDFIAENEWTYDHKVQVNVRYDDMAQYHRKRKESLMGLIPILDIHDSDRCRYVLEAMRSNRYKPMEENRLTMREPMEPLHDWTSHPVSAAEFFATYIRVADGGTVPLTREEEQRRRKRAEYGRRRPDATRRVKAPQRVGV